MSDKRLYELVNPSDKISFRATLTEAAIIADRMLDAPYFVKDAVSGEAPTVADLQADYDAIGSTLTRSLPTRLRTPLSSWGHARSVNYSKKPSHG